MIDPNNLYTYKAKIINIVDGDTLDISIDLGFRFEWKLVRVRLLCSKGGVNTPELHSPDTALRTKAQQAKIRTAQLAPVGSSALVKTELDELDSFGRILANMVNENGTNIGDTLLSEGLADLWFRGK